MNDEALIFAHKLLNEDIVRQELTKYGEPSPEELIHMTKALIKSTVDPSPVEYEVLTNLAADLLRQGEGLPQWLATFVADILQGVRKHPSKPGPSIKANFERDYKLCKISQRVAHAFNLPLYTNNELSEKMTAVDIVSQASGMKKSLIISACKKYYRWG